MSIRERNRAATGCGTTGQEFLGRASLWLAGGGCGQQSTELWEGDGNERVISERHLLFLRDGVSMVLEQFIDGQMFDDVSYAYSSGLASGFYGKSSVIAQGYRATIARRLRSLRVTHAGQERMSMLVGISRVGLEHGSLIRSRTPCVARI